MGKESGNQSMRESLVLVITLLSVRPSVRPYAVPQGNNPNGTAAEETKLRVTEKLLLRYLTTVCACFTGSVNDASKRARVLVDKYGDQKAILQFYIK